MWTYRQPVVINLVEKCYKKKKWKDMENISTEKTKQIKNKDNYQYQWKKKENIITVYYMALLWIIFTSAF